MSTFNEITPPLDANSLKCYNDTIAETITVKNRAFVATTTIGKINYYQLNTLFLKFYFIICTLCMIYPIYI